VAARHGITGWFDPRARHRDGGLLALIASDYVACYRRRGESPRRLALLCLPRLLANPELHATMLIRIALAGPRLLFPFWRTVLISKHSIDIMPETEIGPGLRLPHPHSITLGWAASIGSNVTILHNVSIGGPSHPRDFRTDAPAPHVPAEVYRPCPVIGDDVIIYSGSFVIGPITIGPGAVIGAESWLDHDLEPGALHRGRQQ
jgi:serine O-acetyltransferase